MTTSGATHARRSSAMRASAWATVPRRRSPFTTATVTGLSIARASLPEYGGKRGYASLRGVPPRTGDLRRRDGLSSYRKMPKPERNEHRDAAGAVVDVM